MTTTLTLQNFTFSELFNAQGLARLDEKFLQELKEFDPNLAQKLLNFRQHSATFSPEEISYLLISCATFLEKFLAKLFNIEENLVISQLKTIEQNPISAFKKYFVLRRAKKEINRIPSLISYSEAHAKITAELAKTELVSKDKELALALLGNKYLADPERYQAEIETLVAWCTHALVNPEEAGVQGWVSFHIPERLDYQQLIPVIKTEKDELSLAQDQLRLRDGFKLTDERMSARAAQDEVNYCIYCHDHDGDFCSKGFPVKKGDPTQGFKKNPLDIILTGCPLEEKISEMDFLKRDGHTLAALAMVMVDNPMCPATGHRICNDCMKACIYQKQEPVNIPQIETRVLTDVLNLPWGVEIYDLLTRWNPLRSQQWVMKPYNGLKVLIAGMGPAGFTLAHHLLLEGFAIVGFDGLKIEPLPEKLIREPIQHFNDLKEALDERLMSGFGGVAEYGITVRWDKNFLKLIYLSLMRRPYFQVFGGVRFGGTITVEDAWELGFDHFVVAVGAGLPKALSIPHSLAPGMRQANDFLMALQLGNAAKKTSLTNLQIRLPAVVIGGGLTGVDTATELQAYYITQVEKIHERYEILKTTYGEDHLLKNLDRGSQEILAEYLTHAREIMNERRAAQTEKRAPDFIKLIRKWGGVSIAYRRSMQESPAYINNHEELKKALEEGIYYLEGLEPNYVALNASGYAEKLICKKRIKNAENQWIPMDQEVQLPARSILVATGTQPNIAYEFEHRGTFNRSNLQYQHYENADGELIVAPGIAHCKEKHFGAFTSYQKQDKRVSLIGDTHPVFHGNVVKAIASGMRTYPKILELLKDKLQQRGNEKDYQQFRETMQNAFSMTVEKIERKTKDILELTISAPLAAKHFKPGQFYRLQNFETLAPTVHHTLLQMDPLALVTADCKADKLTFIIHEHNAPTKLCALLKPGEPVTLMGPTGVRAKIPAHHETVLIIGNQASFAFLRSYGADMRASHNRVLYVAELNNKEELYCQTELQHAADHILWITKNAEAISSQRAEDMTMTQTDALPALEICAKENPNFSLHDVDRIYVVGDIDLLRRFQAAQKTILKNIFLKDPKIFGSVYGNMQCMLKGVCAQCLQWQIDPETGERTKAVFACSWQDQPLEIIDIEHMHERQMQNKLLDQLNSMWVDHVFAQGNIARV